MDLKIRKLVRKILEESLIGEEYPIQFDMNAFKALKTFKQRIEYCENNLKRLNSGSSRIVYKIDNNKVLKLAKNKKGIEQNDTEIDLGSGSYFSSIVAQVFDSHPDGLWVEMELAIPINKYEFRRLTNFEINDVRKYLVNFQEENSGKKPIHYLEQPLVDRLDNDTFVQQLREFVAGTDALAGDLGEASSYGIIRKNGHDELVLIDFGITTGIYKDFYSESKLNGNTNNNADVLFESEFKNNINDNFQKWFSGSKVIDKNGVPLVVYHGTGKKFSKFNLKNAPQPIIWFTSDKSTIEAGEAGAQGKGHVMDLYASIKNPAGWPEYEKYGLGQLSGLGYDGAILSDPNGTITGFAFKPNQLKSIKNKGEWDSNNKNIFKEENLRQLGKNLADQINTPYVIIYRAAPITANEFFDRDFITLSKKFAIEHAEHNHVYHEEPQHVIQALVSTKNVYDAFNPGEYFYSGENKKAKEIYITKGQDYKGLNESVKWNRGGIILIKGEKLKNGKQKLYANIPKQIIEVKSGTQTTHEIEKFVLGKEFYRIRYDDKGNLKAFLVERPNNIGIDKNTNIVYKNENKIPLHWETLKFNNIGVMTRNLESQILQIDNIEFFI